MTFTYVLQKKKPRSRGFFFSPKNQSELLGVLGTDSLQLNTAIDSQAIDQLLVALVFRADVLASVTAHRLRLALAFGVDAIGRNALIDQEVLDRIGTLLG